MDNLIKSHIERLRNAVFKRYSMQDVAGWIVEHTKLGGLPYSFEGHHFQKVIVNDTSKEVNVQKCSQVGVSEASVRLALGMVSVMRPFTVAYTLPTAHFAGTFTKTRIDAVIDGSDTLKAAIHNTTDNNEIKRFGDSYLYIRGAASSNSPISIPCDMLIHDEVDFSDQEVLKQYISRLGHSKWKLIRRFSTPTLPGFGINKAFMESRRYLNMCKCNHCGFWFVPDYYKHVRIPGYEKALAELNSHTLSFLAWKQAALHCPKCSKVPSLLDEHREFVCENPTQQYEAAGYQVSPFDAPTIVSVPDLITASTWYGRIQDFQNFGLGLPCEDTEATLLRSDMLPLFVQDDSVGASSINVMGVDVGSTYYVAIGAVDGYGDIFVIHTEQIPMADAKRRIRALQQQYKVVCTVIDSGPHAETVMSLQAEDPTIYASVYMRSKSILTHTVLDKDAEESTGKEFVRQVNVNRSRAFDAYMNFIREGHLRIRESELREGIITHHTSMKRIKHFEAESGEYTYSWQKSDGNDHFHHTFLYLWIASRIKQVGSRSIVSLPLATLLSFKLKVDV